MRSFDGHFTIEEVYSIYRYTLYAIPQLRYIGKIANFTILYNIIIVRARRVRVYELLPPRATRV